MMLAGLHTKNVGTDGWQAGEKEQQATETWAIPPLMATEATGS